MIRLKFVHTRLLAGPPSLGWRVALALAFVATPTFLRLAADHLVTGTAFATYYPFVLIAALFIGLRGAAAVALTSALLANYLFMEPRHVLFGRVGDTAGTVFFLLACSLILAVVSALRRAVVEVEAGLRREADLNAELKHLNVELQHRVKNTLTVVQGLATHTFRGAPDGDETVRVFRGRLQALAEAHAVLTSGRWELCRLPDLAVRALAPFNGHGAVHAEGPACSLPEPSCVPLVLALHELGANSVKYGALSVLTGAVEVRWDVEPVAGDPARGRLVLDWTETGGPAVTAPTRRGLGSRLLSPQRGIDAVLLDFRPEGLTCRIVVDGAVPLDAAAD